MQKNPEPVLACGNPPRLVGDIGGTNARFAILAAPGAAPERVLTLACADYPGPAAAIRAYAACTGIALPALAALGIANPVDGDHIAMTNHVWSFSIEALRRELGFERLRVINDFTALALALPLLPAQSLQQIGGGAARAGSPIALLGPGTGLGISGLIPAGSDDPLAAIPLASEGGHVTLPARTAREAQIIARLAERHGHVSAERALSGPGLEDLLRAILQLEGLAVEVPGAAEITARALGARCRHCVEAVHTFCALLGTVAGDLALTLGARGGVYIGGGIVPRLGDFFANSAFRQRFEDKGRFSAYLAQIPTRLIRAPHPALLGAGRALDNPHAGGHEASGAH